MHVYLQDAPRVIALVASPNERLDPFEKSYGSSGATTAILISSQTPVSGVAGATTLSASTRAVVEVAKDRELENLSLQRLSSRPIAGCLGLINVGQDLFVAVVTSAQEVGSVRPTESVMRITSVAFFCVNRSTWDDTLISDTSGLALEPYGSIGPGTDGAVTQPSFYEHPCANLKKLLGTGSFYYAKDGSFDISTRLDKRLVDGIRHDISHHDSRFVWNNYMIQPLIRFRERLDPSDRARIDAECFLLLAIQGFVGVYDMANSSSAQPTAPLVSLSPLIPATSTASTAAAAEASQSYMPMAPPSIPASSSTAAASASAQPLPQTATASSLPPTSQRSTLALISRLSWKRAGTRFNTRGIDDDGNVANFVETETIFTNDQVIFSYNQIRGSVPLFWEQQGLQAFNARIQITRSRVASQPSFDRHFADLISQYSHIHAINLLGTRDAETILSAAYAEHMRYSSAEAIAVLPPAQAVASDESDQDNTEHLGLTNFDFHTVSRNTGGLDGVRNELRFLGPVQLKRKSFGYTVVDGQDGSVLTRQKGIFRTNCLDCLDRTNVIQDMLSQETLTSFFEAAGHRRPVFEAHLSPSHAIWTHHRVLWAENGDALSRIYAGTGALNTSFTRSGKKTLGGLLSDAAKSAGRIYINNFQDKGKQNVIDVLLGNMANQRPVTVFDPVLDSATAELNARVDEYSSSQTITIFSGTFNLNGKPPYESLVPWLFPDGQDREPDIFAIGFQEIVQLTPQQILMTDPDKIRIWEAAIMETLSNRTKNTSDYILLRSEQLVGTALIVLIREELVHQVRQVEAATKKTGLKGMSGNKGGVAIRLDYFDTSICFVTAHFAAGHSNFEERNADYWTISRGLSFQRGRTIGSHDHVVWLGDFNYRIDLPNETVRSMALREDFQSLYLHDQLGRGRSTGAVFPGYEEGPILFAPTYKYDNGSTTYDSSEKQRIPAWTDRILYRGVGIEQQCYYRAELKTSDHRPVYSIFTAPVRIVDHVKKNTIKKQLMDENKRTHGLAILSDSSSDTETDRDLPDPSSEQQNWWNQQSHVGGDPTVGFSTSDLDISTSDDDTSSEMTLSETDCTTMNGKEEGWTQINPFRPKSAPSSQRRIKNPPPRASSPSPSNPSQIVSSSLFSSTTPTTSRFRKTAPNSPTIERRVLSGPPSLVNSIPHIHYSFPSLPTTTATTSSSSSPVKSSVLLPSSSSSMIAKPPPPPIPIKPFAIHPNVNSNKVTPSSSALLSRKAPVPIRPTLGPRSASYTSQKSAKSLLDDSDSDS